MRLFPLFWQISAAAGGPVPVVSEDGREAGEALISIGPSWGPAGCVCPTRLSHLRHIWIWHLKPAVLRRERATMALTLFYG